MSSLMVIKKEKAKERKCNSEVAEEDEVDLTEDKEAKATPDIFDL